jgi:hypothetical protein
VSAFALGVSTNHFALRARFGWPFATPNNEERIMKLSAPRQLTWWIALIAGGVGVLEHYRVVHLPFVGRYASLLVVGAWALLILATLLKAL